MAAEREPVTDTGNLAAAPTETATCMPVADPQAAGERCLLLRVAGGDTAAFDELFAAPTVWFWRRWCRCCATPPRLKKSPSRCSCKHGNWPAGSTRR